MTMTIKNTARLVLGLSAAALLGACASMGPAPLADSLQRQPS